MCCLNLFCCGKISVVFTMFYKCINKIYNNIDICSIIRDNINFYINGEVCCYG